MRNSEMKAAHRGTSPWTREAEAGGSELEAIVGYRSGSRMARAKKSLSQNDSPSPS